MKYGIEKVWTDTGWQKVEHCMAVVCFCVAGAALLFMAWAVVIGWTAVIERLAQ
jgi:hypothetical protein